MKGKHLPNLCEIRTAPILSPQVRLGRMLGARSTPHLRLGLQLAPSLQGLVLLPLLTPNTHKGVGKRNRILIDNLVLESQRIGDFAYIT